MIKRTLHFSQPAYLKVLNSQLVIEMVERTTQVPLEDIGLVFLEHPQITVTQTVLQKLMELNAVVITCDERHLPAGMFLNLEGHSEHAAKCRAQLESSEPLRKQLWQQTIKAKIMNQAAMLYYVDQPDKLLKTMSKEVLSGDTSNLEGQAARYYWKKVFKNEVENFERNRTGEPPNNLLNYGYAILRAMVARAIVGAGLLPVRGIFHRNQYNAYALADDIMEPYRPYVDRIVLDILQETDIDELHFMGKEEKKELLQIATKDVYIDGQKSPLMVALTRTCASLAKCFEGESKKILYPDMYFSFKQTWT
jgi:CRISPR-associated protein Cas1